MTADNHDVQDAVAYLHARLDRGDFDYMPAEALGPQFAPLRTVALVIRIVLIDWQEYLIDSAPEGALLFPNDPNRWALRSEIVDLARRVNQLVRRRAWHGNDPDYPTTTKAPRRIGVSKPFDSSMCGRME